MTLEKAAELLTVQAYIGQGYNLNSAKLILAEVQAEHGQTAVDEMIVKLELNTVFGFSEGDVFKRPTGKNS